MPLEHQRRFLGRFRPGRWVFAVLAVAAATLLAKPLEPILAAGSPFALPFLYFALVLGIAFRHGIGPAILATAAASLAIPFVVVSSSSLGVDDSQDLLLRLVFFAASSLLAAGFIHAARRRAP